MVESARLACERSRVRIREDGMLYPFYYWPIVDKLQATLKFIARGRIKVPGIGQCRLVLMFDDVTIALDPGCKNGCDTLIDVRCC